MNTRAITGMAIVTAFHQRGWSPGTDITECLADFREIQRQAYHNLAWAGCQDQVIFDHDIAQAIWGLDREEFVEHLESLATWLPESQEAAQ